MKEVYSDLIQYRGSHYDFGVLQGEKLRRSLTLVNRENQWKVRQPRFQIDVEETKEVFMKLAPLIWEELNGLRDSLDWSMEKVLQEFGGYRVNGERSGCSILSGDTYLVRNYDYHPKTYDGRYVLYQPTDGGYATIGPSQRITGRMDGMNEKGLAMGYNLTNRKKPGDGFICTMIGRIILETCADVTEAVECVRAIPHRHSFSYIVYDQTDGMVVIESSPRGVEARSADACTNHFERLTEENRFNLDDSHRRLDLMKNANVQTAEDAFALLNSPAEDIFSLKYSSWSGTIHTSLYEPEKMCAWIGIGGNQTPKKFDFESWLFGTDAEGAKVHGVVDTDLPLFIWMRMQIGSAERVSVVIEVKNLSKSYKDFQAVKDSTFTVDKGEIFGFLGPNGAGKSTTINILSTMLKPTGGSVIINGYDVTKHKNKVRESIGIIFQENTLDEKLTAKENLMLHCKLYRVPRSKRKARIDEVLEIVDLTDSLNSTVEKFSGGMKRRLEIARGLLHYPKVLFLDEPSVGLDPQTRAHIWDTFSNLKRKRTLRCFLRPTILMRRKLVTGWRSWITVRSLQ
ncbi:daunorubicin resistance ABC transporter, ATP-binding protein [Geomicrobium sp. JCM 19037]|nr:daunorubicin resistance ABC transporter, ATP-binding protein [Geomicrobium sp. JCM 19037]